VFLYTSIYETTVKLYTYVVQELNISKDMKKFPMLKKSPIVITIIN